jgi:hypothetical protein
MSTGSIYQRGSVFCQRIQVVFVRVTDFIELFVVPSKSEQPISITKRCSLLILSIQAILLLSRPSTHRKFQVLFELVLKIFDGLRAFQIQTELRLLVRL